MAGFMEFRVEEIVSVSRASGVTVAWISVREKHMEFNTTTTVITYSVIFALLVAGTVMSPMTTSTVVMVSIGLLVFGVLSLLIGIKHGEYRASHQ